MKKTACFLIHLLVEADGSLFLPMWPTDSSGLPKYYDYGNSIVPFPGMIRILVYINSLISCLASPAYLEEVKMDRVWVLPPEKQLLDDDFKSITFPNNNIYNFWWKEGYYFQSYNERESFGVYILFDFKKIKITKNSTPGIRGLSP